MKTLPGFDYSIKRARRKTIGLYVRNGQVEVRTPHHVKHEEIHRWVCEKAEWVKERLAEHRTQESEKPAIYHGGNLLFLGAQRSLSMEIGSPGITEKNNTLLIRHRANTNIPALLEKWLKEEARLYLLERISEIGELMQEKQRITDIRFRKTRSKWGHCTSSGVLQFNWLIIMAPPEVIDYLIIHELSHLEHLNHSPAFWKRVAIFCPDYRQQRNWLRINGHRLWI